ncbi:hypothetical protein BDY21DRAFT_35369 [Lineolata rhizophorae]|uniref:Maintenance of mitochondrial morphology protein 1 n=1 Tax=Lineolata rhizophorae TaxID=578093 RepID=A0A6A6NZY5_9PEZI|nr:hypothetical protein BDY21DRAFT_35369 [Lineolata rhizophorae]
MGGYCTLGEFVPEEVGACVNRGLRGSSGGGSTELLLDEARGAFRPCGVRFRRFPSSHSLRTRRNDLGTSIIVAATSIAAEMARQEDPPPPPQQQQSGLSFTQGFLLGQLSISLLIFFFIKFFIFGDPPSPDARATARAAARRQRTLSHQRSTTSSSSSDSQNKSPGATSASASLRRRRSAAGAILRGGSYPPSLSPASILAKTYYSVHGHRPESLDWFNVLVAQTIAQLRADAWAPSTEDGSGGGEGLVSSLTAVLNGPSKPDWVGDMRVTEISLGEEFPIFSNCRIIPVEEGGLASLGDGWGVGGGPKDGAGGEGRLQARMDVDLSDVITLGVETKLVLNYPRLGVAVLPVALSVSIERFSGTLCVSFIPPTGPPPSPPPPNTSSTTTAPSPNPSQSTQPPHLRPPPFSTRPSFRSASPISPQENPFPPPPSSEPNNHANASPNNSSSGSTTGRTPTTLTFTFQDDYRLDLSVRSLVGSRSRLQDVPKIAQLVEARIHAWFDERCVEPRFQQVVLPSLWPRKKNARGGMEGNEEGEEDLEPEDEMDPGRRERGSEAKRWAEGSLEQRMAEEGRKLREAEVAEGLRWRLGAVGSEDRRQGSSQQRRQHHASVDGEMPVPSGESSGAAAFRMPGSMPGAMLH